MTGWTKLFSSIVTSSVWCEPHATVRVWVAMLATADADGVVEGSIPGFANLARVTTAEMQEAVQTLSSPDHHSRTPDHEGRRIEAVEGGWQILNYRQYRDRGQAKEGSKAPAMRRLRARRRAEAEAKASSNALLREVTRGPEERREMREAVRTTEQGPAADAASPAVAGRSDVLAVFDHWKATMGHPAAKLSPERERIIRARLKDFSVAQLTQAIDGCAASPFHMGQNDRQQRFDKLTLIFRNCEQVEKFLQLAGSTHGNGHGPAAAPTTADREEWTRRRMAALAARGRG